MDPLGQVEHVQGQRQALDLVEGLIIAVRASPPVDHIQDQAHVGTVDTADQFQCWIQADHPGIHDLPGMRAAHLGAQELKDHVHVVAGQHVRIFTEFAHEPLPLALSYHLGPAVGRHKTRFGGHAGDSSDALLCPGKGCRPGVALQSVGKARIYAGDGHVVLRQQRFELIHGVAGEIPIDDVGTQADRAETERAADGDTRLEIQSAREIAYR